MFLQSFGINCPLPLSGSFIFTSSHCLLCSNKPRSFRGWKCEQDHVMMSKDVNSQQFLCSTVTTLTLWFFEVHWDKDSHISSGYRVPMCCKLHVKLRWLADVAVPFFFSLVGQDYRQFSLPRYGPAVQLPFPWPQPSGLLILLSFSTSHAFTSHSFLTDEQLTCSWISCYS